MTRTFEFTGQEVRKMLAEYLVRKYPDLDGLTFSMSVDISDPPNVNILMAAKEDKERK